MEGKQKKKEKKKRTRRGRGRRREVSVNIRTTPQHNPIPKLTRTVNKFLFKDGCFLQLDIIDFHN